MEIEFRWEWYYNDRPPVYFIKNGPITGCSVYLHKGLWYPSIVHGLFDKNLKPYEDVNEALRACEKEYMRILNEPVSKNW